MEHEGKFKCGRLLATPGAIAALSNNSLFVIPYLERHVSGDWGDMSPGDKLLNDAALVDGSRIFSAYLLPDGVKIWVITDAVGADGNRASTCVLLPDEY